MSITEQAVIMDEVFDTDEMESPFGQRWGGELLQLRAEHWQALRQGKVLTVDVMNEYILFIKLDETPRNIDG
jgi:hypothetical protein